MRQTRIIASARAVTKLGSGWRSGEKIAIFNCSNSELHTTSLSHPTFLITITTTI